jgi:hypothetical protein
MSLVCNIKSIIRCTSCISYNYFFILQVGAGFNRDAWNDLEKYVRAIARKNRNVYCCTGHLYLPK